MTTSLLLFPGLLAGCLAFSCWIAYLCGGGHGWGWGIFGPIGWVAAAVSQLRARASREDAVRRKRRRLRRTR